MTAEVEKWDVRCGNCHRRRTLHQLIRIACGWARRMRELRAYDGLVRCSTCRAYRPFADFAFADMKAGFRQHNCRVCHATYRRAHYLEKPG